MVTAAATNIIDELEEVIARGPSARRVETLRRITDLFLNDAARYTQSQVALFDDVLMRLCATMEAAVREELSERLAMAPSAPPTVVERLARDAEIAVARPVLLHSGALDDLVLADIADTMGQDHMLAIAGRQRVAPMVTDVLVRRGDGRVALSVAANRGAHFSDKGYERLVARARESDVLAECVGLRADIPAHLFRAILSSAKEHVQDRLLAASAAKDKAQVRKAVAGVADRIAVGSSRGQRDYTATHRAILGQHRAGELGEPELRAYAEQGLFDETVCTMSVLCNVPLEMIERLFLGERPDPILILARAADLSWPTLRAVLRVRPGGAGTSSAGLDEARENYDRLTAKTAQRVLRFWQVRESAGA